MYLTEQYLQDLYDSEQVASLCPTAGALAATIELAEAAVESALRVGGYTALVPPSVFSTITSVPAAVKLAAYRQWLILAHDRKGIAIEADTLKEWTQPIEDLRSGLIEISSPVDTTRAPGGTSFTDVSGTTTSPTRELIFSAERMGDH